MKKWIAFGIIGFLILSGTGLSYAAKPAEIFKGFLAVSTGELEELKKSALIKVFDIGYKMCYENTLAIVEKMPDTQIYAKDKGIIAVYCLSLNSTPAGIFFEKVDETHTKVLISSASSSAKDWVASNVFSGKVQKPLARLNI